MRIFFPACVALLMATGANASAMKDLVRNAFSAADGQEVSTLLQGAERARINKLTTVDGPVEARARVVRRFGQPNCGRVYVYILQQVPGAQDQSFIPLPGVEMNMCADGSPAQEVKE